MNSIQSSFLFIHHALVDLGAQSFAFLLLIVISIFVTLLVDSSIQRKRRHALAITLNNKNNQIAQLEDSLAASTDKIAQLEDSLEAYTHVHAELAVKSRDAAEYAARNTELHDKLEQLSAKYNAQNVEQTANEHRLKAEKNALEEKIELLKQSRQQLSDEFQLLANKIFDEKQLKFNQESEKQLAATLTPFKSQLSDFRQRVDDIYAAESKERYLLKQQINELREQSHRISEDANNLSHALRFDNKTQGNWGELTLVRALEMCGLSEPGEYETQVSLQADDNSRQVPDVIVHLPGGRDIIIDAKVSLLAYSRFFEADDEAVREEAIADHVQSVRQHVKQLSAKAYQQIPGLQTLDYVMLYIPVEGASALALQSYQGLWEEAYEKNIVLVSPTNLLAILRSVETIWRHEKQNKNAEEIARQAGNLHDKFVGLIKTLEDVGRGIEQTQRAYDKAFVQLSQGRGNLVARVKTLETLGAKTKQSIPPHILPAEDDASDTVLELEESVE